jgi:hypothetical protein
MTDSNPPEADEELARDPNKPAWHHDCPIEYELDQTAAVVIVESEVLGQIYDLLRRKRFRMGVPEDAPESVWLCKVSIAVAKVLNDYHNDDFRDTNCLAIGTLLMNELMDDLRESMTWVAEVYFEDVIGFSVISGTTKVMLHFSQEDLDNGGISTEREG